MKIGVSGPFTGKRSTYGDLIKASTFEIAKEMHLEDKIEFVFLDDKAQVPDALKAAKGFIEGKVDAVIGHFNSECAKNVAKKYHANQIIFVAPASTTITIPFENKGYVHRTCPNNNDQIELIKSYVLENRISKLGVVKDDSPYAKELAAITKQELTKIGVEVIELKISENLQNIDTYWFLGTHYSCIEEGKKLLEFSESATMLFCDDCYIDEFFNHFSGLVNENDVFVVGLSHEDGYRNCYKKSLEALILYLLYSITFKVEKENWKLYKI